MPETPAIDPQFRPARNRTGGTLAANLCVKADAANGLDAVALTAADTDVCTGVLDAAVSDGRNGDRCIRGRHKVVASAAIAAGVNIAPEANGKVKTAVAGDRVIGQSVEAAAADNDVIMAELNIGANALE